MKKLLIPLIFLVGILAGFIFSPKTFHLVSPMLQNIPHVTIPEENYSLPTLQQIFAEDHSWTATLSAERKTVMIATGDVIPARVVNINATNKNNFKWPFEKTADVLKSADITFINLEAPLLQECPLTNEGFVFCGSYKHLEGLQLAGVDVASLANNHAGNYGNEGVEFTTRFLRNNSIAVAGVDGVVYEYVKGINFAFLGYNDIGVTPESIWKAEEKKIKEDIAHARNQAEVVIVTYHWGEEYRAQPDERQKYLGRFTIDAGADLVIGNHPHWIQPIEIYKGKLITYAHGNFIFDQEWSTETKQGVVGKYTFYDKDLIDVEYMPVLIEDYGQPHFLSGEEKKKIIDKMMQESLNLAR